MENREIAVDNTLSIMQSQSTKIGNEIMINRKEIMYSLGYQQSWITDRILHAFESK